MRTVCEQMVSRVALPGERAADPFGHYGMVGGAAGPSDLLDVPLTEQSNWVAYRLRPPWGPNTQNA
jgi:hypothetical protein